MTVYQRNDRTGNMLEIGVEPIEDVEHDDLESLRERYNELRAAIVIYTASRHETTRAQRLEAYAVMCDHIRQGRA